MDLRQLRSVIALAEEGHFARAAKRLHIVPSALSMQIRQLEDELGGKLFERNTRQLALTDAGRIMLEGARALHAQADTLRQQVMRQLRGDTGVLRIGFSGGWGIAEDVIQAVRAFHAAHPGVEVVLREMGPADQLAALRAYELELGYTARVHMLPEDLQIHRSWPMEWHVLMASDHPLVHQEVINASMLTDQTLVAYDEALIAPQVQPLLARLLDGAAPRMVRTNSVVAVLSHVAAGLGITLVPGIETSGLMPSLVSRPFEQGKAVLELMLIGHRQLSTPTVLRYLEQLSTMPPAPSFVPA